jgi:hypothetical protein
MCWIDLPCRALAPLKVDELVEIADPGETSILLVPGQPGYGAMRQISQRMARCRQLPVKQRDDARFGLVEHEIADAIVAMHQAGGIVGGNVPGQPGDLFPVDERADLQCPRSSWAEARVSPSFFFRVPEKRPRTVCRCQPIALATSSTVAALGSLQHRDHRILL